MAPSGQSEPTRQTVPRRRQRKEVDEGGSLRNQPQRKRSKLSPPITNLLNGDTTLNDDIVELSGDNNSDHLDLTSSNLDVDIPLRSRQNGASRPRANRFGGISILTENPNYRIEHLPSFPEALKKTKKEYRGSIASWTSQTLVVTREEAFVWDANVSHSTPHCRKFELPYPSRADETIPYGHLVNSGSNEIGLVIVVPTSGKITYWENVENADALKLFENRRNGIEGYIKGMSYGERVVEFQEAGQAGFVLTLSSGRTAQLLLRDAQGRPLIQVKLLTHTVNESGGILSGFRSMFGSGNYLKDATATRTLALHTKGKSILAIANTNANFHFWLLDWAGSASFQAEINAYEKILEVVREKYRPVELGSQSKLKVVDFDILKSTKTNHGSSFADEVDQFDLIALIMIYGPNTTSFAVVELSLMRENSIVGRILEIDSYDAPLGTNSKYTGRVFVSSTQQSAFVVFQDALTILSIAKPRRQSSTEGKNSSSNSRPYQDTIYLRENRSLQMSGAGLEDLSLRQHESSLILFVRGFGLVRALVDEPKDSRKVIARVAPDAKNKLEQAVFNGTSEDNPFNLIRSSKANFSLKDVEAAALNLSHEIVSSDTSFLPPILSMELHLQKRANALKDLASHLKASYPVLSENVRWHLLWNAEKIAAATQIWSAYEARCQTDPDNPRLLPELMEYINDEFKTSTDPEHGEHDQLRRFFTKDVENLEILLPWAYQGIYNLARLKEYADQRQLIPFVSDANDLVIFCLEVAWNFREENAQLYNLDLVGNTDGGILRSGFENVTEFWTSMRGTPSNLTSLVRDCGSIVANLDDKDLNPEQSQLILKIAQDNPKILELTLKSWEECCRWTEAQHSEEAKRQAETLRAELKEGRYHMLTKLPSLGMAEKGLTLAEESSDMRSLVAIFSDEALFWREALNEENEKKNKLLNEKSKARLDELGAHDRNISIAKEHILELNSRLERYFEKFGDSWANAYYSAYADKKMFTAILDGSALPWQIHHVTKYLQANVRGQKMGWINEVTANRNFTSAGMDLANVATEESSIWSKKVELSLAKLTFAAAEENNQTSKPSQDADNVLHDAQMLMKIQNKLADHTFPSLYNALDANSELDILMTDFAQNKTAGRDNLQQLLERGLDSLRTSKVMDAEQLIDVLTLMDHKECDMVNRDIAGQEYFLALQVLKHSGFRPDSLRYQTLLKIIWRRCFLDDDWESFNHTDRQTDKDIADSLITTTLFMTFYEGFKESLFDEPNPIPILSTDDVKGAGSSPEDFKDRFSSIDLCTPIAQDTGKEDAALKRVIEKQRLNHWISHAKELANEWLEKEAKEKAEYDKKVKEAATRQKGKEKRN